MSPSATYTATDPFASPPPRETSAQPSSTLDRSSPSSSTPTAGPLTIRRHTRATSTPLAHRTLAPTAQQLEQPRPQWEAPREVLFRRIQAAIGPHQLSPEALAAHLRSLTPEDAFELASQLAQLVQKIEGSYIAYIHVVADYLAEQEQRQIFDPREPVYQASVHHIKAISGRHRSERDRVEQLRNQLMSQMGVLPRVLDEILAVLGLSGRPGLEALIKAMKAHTQAGLLEILQAATRNYIHRLAGRGTRSGERLSREDLMKVEQATEIGSTADGNGVAVFQEARKKAAIRGVHLEWNQEFGLAWPGHLNEETAQLIRKQAGNVGPATRKPPSDLIEAEARKASPLTARDKASHAQRTSPRAVYGSTPQQPPQLGPATPALKRLPSPTTPSPHEATPKKPRLRIVTPPRLVNLELERLLGEFQNKADEAEAKVEAALSDFTVPPAPFTQPSPSLQLIWDALSRKIKAMQVHTNVSVVEKLGGKLEGVPVEELLGNLQRIANLTGRIGEHQAMHLVARTTHDVFSALWRIMRAQETVTADIQRALNNWYAEHTSQEFSVGSQRGLPLPMGYHELRTFATGPGHLGWLSDHAILGALLQHRLPREQVVDPVAFAAWRVNGFPPDQHPRLWPQTDRVTIPYHDVNHWTLIHFDRTAHTVWFRDSLPTPARLTQMQTAAQNFAQHNGFTLDGWRREVAPGTRQANADDCGIYTIENAEALRENNTGPLNIDPLTRRRDILLGLIHSLQESARAREEERQRQTETGPGNVATDPVRLDSPEPTGQPQYRGSYAERLNTQSLATHYPDPEAWNAETDGRQPPLPSVARLSLEPSK